jgi:hypothetical protein
MKRNGSEIFFASMRKKCFFRLFRIDAKRRNLKRNENGTKKRKQNEKKQKTAIIFTSKRNEAKRKQKLPSFSLRSEMKQKGSKKLPSFSLRSEMKTNFFRFDAKK